MGSILSAYGPTFPFQGDDFDDAPSYESTQSQWAAELDCNGSQHKHQPRDSYFTLEAFANFWVQQVEIGSSSRDCERCPGSVLHDSAASLHSLSPADKISSTLEFLKRLETSVDNGRKEQLNTDCGRAQADVGKAIAALPPREARKTFLLGPPCSACCPRRTQTAEGINALRTVKDVDIEGVLRLACKVFDTDMACITMLTGDAYSIVQGTGMLAPGPAPAQWGFCGWSFLNSCHELLVVEDLAQDLRFSRNFFVTSQDFQLRFYVGCPLVAADGHRLGTLCIVGREPRSFDTTRGTVLANLAEMAVRQLERNWALSEATQSHVQLMRSLACYEEAFLFLDTSQPGNWRVLHINRAAAGMLGCEWSKECLSYLSGIAAKEQAAQIQANATDDVEPTPLPQHEDVPLGSLLQLSPEDMRSELARTHIIQNLTATQDPHAPGKHYDLHLRQANTESIASTEGLQVGVPSFCEAADSYGRHYYIATLIPVDPEHPVQGGHADLDRQSGSSDSASSTDHSQLQHSDGQSSPQSTLVARLPRLSSGHSCQKIGQSLDALAHEQAHRSRQARAQMHSQAALPATGPFEGLLLGTLIGQGSFGRVYRGVWKGQLVGVKIVSDVSKLSLDASGQPIEAVVTKSVRHMGITRTLAHAWWVAQDRGGVAGQKQCWMIMEYCNRGTLVDAVVKGWFRHSVNALEESSPHHRTVAMTAFEIASAMSFLHAKGVVHGDLSGGNVMLTSCQVNPHHFSARVVDFGLARSNSPVDRVTQNMYGTVTHMAPELMAGSSATPAADVYSFGVLLWEMLTSTRAWAGLQHARVMCMVGMLHQSLAIPEGPPQALKGLLRQCLNADPSARPSFAEISQLLSIYLQESWCELHAVTKDSSHAAGLHREEALHY